MTRSSDEDSTAIELSIFDEWRNYFHIGTSSKH